MERAVDRDVFFFQQPAHRLEPLVEARAAFVEADAEPREFVRYRNARANPISARPCDALQNSNKMLVASTTGALVSPAPATPPPGSDPNGIAAGPDGNVWVTGFFNGSIMSFSASSPFSLLSTTTVPSGAGSQPAEIVTGPDNALWFTEQIGGKIGRLVPGGASPPAVELKLPAPYGTPWAIANGSGGGIWFTASGSGHSDIIRIDPTTHAFVAYQLASTTTQSAYGLISGPDGNLWMTDYVASGIVKIQP